MAAAALAAGVSAAADARKESSIAERVGSTAFIQLEAESFRNLTPREQALAYWLAQASIAMDPIFYDQMSRFGLRQKRLLEAIVSHPEGVPSQVLGKIAAFTKLFWASYGNHNETTAQKFLPEFTFEEFKAAALTAQRNKAPGLPSRERLLEELNELRPSLFDPNFEPQATVKNPPSGLDILQASSNNLYAGVALADLKGFVERNPFNSRLIKSPSGSLVEEVYRAGSPDGSIPPGRYAEYLGRANGFLAKAQALADPVQAEVIGALIRAYQTGGPQDWKKFDIGWIKSNPRVDFASGFIEVYRDPRGIKGTAQSFVSVTDLNFTEMMRKVAANSQYFENRAPWDRRYRRQTSEPLMAKAIETVIETGDFHVTTVGDNLPNDNEIHEKYGSKSFIFTSSTRALNSAAGHAALREFAFSKEEVERGIQYGDHADELMTSLHEIIGHGSGKLSPRLSGGAEPYLKEYYSALEEARADLMALWNINDPKLRQLGLVSSPETGKAMYDTAARAPLLQLRRIPRGDTIEEDHLRDRALISNYIADKTGAIVQTVRDGKTYLYVRDYEKMREGVGMLLKELMRIKAEGDYKAIQALMDRYGVRFDPKLRDEVVARYKKLNLPTYYAGIEPELTPVFDARGAVSKVEISYPRDFSQQRLRWSNMFPPSTSTGAN